MLIVESRRLAPIARSVPEARAFTAELTSGLAARVQEAAELVTSELATNCVMHAGTPFDVFVAVDDEAVEIIVSDGCGWLGPCPTSRTNAHGLLLVGLLASSWSAQLETSGKRVCARLLLDDVPIA